MYVFSVANMRNASFKEVRNQWKGSRFFFGKNKVMIHALGKSEQDEHKTNLHKVSHTICGGRGLLFTNCDQKEVVEFFQSYQCPSYARSGFKATYGFALEQGPLKDMAFSMEVPLRKLGLPTKLVDGTCSNLPLPLRSCNFDVDVDVHVDVGVNVDVNVLI